MKPCRRAPSPPARSAAPARASSQAATSPAIGGACFARRKSRPWAQALAANPDLKAAQATLLEARQNTRAEEGSFSPSVSATASRTREQASPAAFGQPGGGTSLFSVYSASLSVSYTFDVFGGIRRQVEQLDAQAEYERDELEAAYLSLTANLVNAVITEASLQAQIEASRQIIAVYQQELNLVRTRFTLGGVSQAEVLLQQSSLAAAMATLPPLQKQYEQERNQIATYLGLLPSQYKLPTIDLATLALPEELPVSLPSTLVEQRPDIRAFAALLHAAAANVGVATANMLPQISLTGSYGREAATVSNLFTPGGIVWSIAASIAQPIFEGGTLRARKRSAVAAMDVAAAQYGSTVNTAFQGVANALVALQKDADTLRADLQSEQTAHGTQQPVMTVKVGQSLDALIIGFASDDLSGSQITDYLVRNVQPQLQSIEGVQTAELLGAQNFALRAWLDPQKMAAYGRS